MNLAIDIGNTKIKVGCFEGDSLKIKYDHLNVDEIKQLINTESPEFVIGSSTATELFDSDEWPNTNLLVSNYKLNMPFRLNYETPETLGADRLAAVAGACKLLKPPFLVIDLGSCITYDFVDEKMTYQGGAISPGVGMRFKAMNSFTARLPNLDIPDKWPPFIGASTKGCMESGVMQGILNEIEGFINAYTTNHGKISVVMSGGDSKYFDKKIKDHIFAAPELVLIGLNEILQYNVADT